MIGLEHYFIVSAIILVIGLIGIIINRRSLIMILMSLELLILAANINFIAFAEFLWDGDAYGHSFVLFILASAAAEAAVGLAILVVYFKSTNTTDIDSVSKMRG